MAREDIAWVKRTVMRSTVCAGAISLAIALPLMVLGKPIVQAWAGAEIQPSQSLLLALGCWTVLSTVGTSLAMFLNAANVVVFQAVCAVAVGVTATVLKTQLAIAAGNEGIVWATCGVYLVLSLIPTLCALPVVYRQKTNQRSLSPAS